jgi:hypothetical protein
MTDTRQLIDRLASRAQPVKPIGSPLRRTLLWALIAGLLIALVSTSFGVRPHLWKTMSSPGEAIEFFGSILTGLCAAYAAFQISVPGRSGSWAWLPLLPLALWLGGIGVGCIGDFEAMGLAAFGFQTHSGECARAILVMCLPLGLVMVLMVRHAGVVRPAPTAMLAALSAAALSSAGVSLFHNGETSLMSLMWHGGVVALLSLACLATGERLFAWIGYAPRRVPPA